MNYYESIPDVTVSRKRVLQELARHGVTAIEFDSEVGIKPEYGAQEVLQWLGY